jgi:hypothetical protein
MIIVLKQFTSFLAAVAKSKYSHFSSEGSRVQELADVAENDVALGR